jgi:hypothetical protein
MIASAGDDSATARRPSPSVGRWSLDALDDQYVDGASHGFESETELLLHGREE